MQAVTLLIGIVGSVAVFLVAPVYGLVVFLVSCAWWPRYLTIQVGTIDFTAPKIIVLAIFAKLFMQTNLPHRFKFVALDKLVIAYFTAEIVAGAITTPTLMAFLENRAGAIFDMVLPYFAVRLIIRERRQYLILLKAIMIIAVPLAVLGFYESLTGNNLVGFLKQYHAWREGVVYTPTPRFGFFRACVTFPISITFGLFFAMFGPVCAGVLHNAKKYKALYWIALGLMVLGCFSSVSSGAVLAGLVSVTFLALYRWRRYWKPAVIVIVVMCVVVEVASDRHFWDVLGDFTFNPQTAWYRSRLIEVALFEGGMSGHWLAGHGPSVDPGWHAQIDRRSYTDLCNHYLLILSFYGVVALLIFIAMNVAAAKRLIKAYAASTSALDRWLIWCLSGGLFGLAVGCATVSLFGQPSTFYHMLLGFAGVMPTIVATGGAGAKEVLRRKLERRRHAQGRDLAQAQLVGAGKENSASWADR
ncbi:MAG: hypothetical protein JSU70_23385 [Phycisphaerales bacterium]|nr:MAG: hypothetical protein JSU70_23385 [Phycisphaerales bacterium]